MVVMDFAWTVAGSAGPNAHHLETALILGADRQVYAGVGIAADEKSHFRTENNAALPRAANPARDMWAPYRATGLQLKLSTEVSPDTVGGGGSSISGRAARWWRMDGSPANSSVPGGLNTSWGGPRASPTNRRTARARSDGGNSSTGTPKSLSRREGTGEKRDKVVNVVGDGPLRAHRHERAESDGPTPPPRRRSFGRRSGSLSNLLLKRSRTASDASEEGREGHGAGDAKGMAGGGGRAGERPSAAPEALIVDEGDREAFGAWAGASSSGTGMGEGRGGGEKVGERGGDGGGRQNGARVRRPLTIHIEDDGGPDDGKPSKMRSRRVEGEASNGLASNPSRTSGGGNTCAEGKRARNVFFSHVWLGFPLYGRLSRRMQPKALAETCLLLA